MIVYCIENEINGKKYIGQTVGTLEKRWGEHISTNHCCRVLKRALNRYGTDNFNYYILKKCKDINELNYYESYYIEKFNTLAPNGYNLTTGGDNKRLSEETKRRIGAANAKSLLGKKHTEETKRKLSLAHKGKNTWTKGSKRNYVMTKEQREMHSKRMKENNPMNRIVHPMLGRKMSKEHCEKLSRAHGGSWFSVYKKDGTFLGKFCNQTECSLKLGIDRCTISRGLKKTVKNPYKYIFIKQVS